MSNRTGLASLLLALACLPLPAATYSDDEEVKITDAKLHSVNYGIDSLEHWVKKAKQGDAQRAEILLRDHAKLVARFDRIPKSSNREYLYVAKRLRQLRDGIQKKSRAESAEAGANSNGQRPPATSPEAPKITKPHPDLGNIRGLAQVLASDIPKYQDNLRQKQRMRSDIKTLKQRFARLPVSDHPDYLATRKQIAAIEDALQPAEGALKMSQSEVKDYLAQIQQKYGEELSLPDARDILTTRELTADEVDRLVSRLKALEESIPADLPKLKHVVDATGTGEYWLKWLQTESAKQLERNLQSITTAIDGRITAGLRDAKQRSELDPEKNRYAFTNVAMRKQHAEDHARTMRTIDQAIRLEKTLGLSKKWSTKKDEMTSYIQAYNARALQASQVHELPKEVGTNLQHTIAKEVLQIKKYDVGRIVKQVVNSQVEPRDRIEHKEFSGRLETIVRKWEQFQVTTVEERDGKLIVYVNDLAKFSRAPSTTPIGKWILTKRFMLGEIKPEAVK